MKNKLLILSLFIIALITFGCSSSEDDSGSDLVKEGGPFAISELAGNWEATLASFIRASDNSEVEIVGDGGSVSLTVQSNGKCTFAIDPNDCEAYTESGEMFWELFNEEYFLTIVWDEFPDDGGTSFRVELTDTSFEIFCPSEDCAEYDFNCDGTPETASLSFIFIRE